MGQAQLLLIVLGVVLVGIAIIAGIQAYDQNNRKSSVDALTHDAMRIASDLQVWAQKPAQFGGPDEYGDLDGTNETTELGAPEAFGYDAAHVNSNGTCNFTRAATAVITCVNGPLGTSVTVEVDGLRDTDISVTEQLLEPAPAG
jgi:hypothetical protein